jgi:hypothetical protein
MDTKNAPARVKFGGTQISRRTVTRGVAWSAPIAAIGVAAPAFAASQPIVVRLCGTTCKHPGSSGPDDTFKVYHFTFCFTANQAVVGNTVTITGMTINGVSKTTAGGAVTPSSVAVVTGQTRCYYIDGLEFPDSANGTGELRFTYTPVNTGVPVNGTVQIEFNGIDRCGTSDGGVNPKDWPHPHDGTAVPPPANNNCI